jgi:hypothetical protein
MLTVKSSMDTELARVLSDKDATQESVFNALLKIGIQKENSAV